MTQIFKEPFFVKKKSKIALNTMFLTTEFGGRVIIKVLSLFIIDWSHTNNEINMVS